MSSIQSRIFEKVIYIININIAFHRSRNCIIRYPTNALFSKYTAAISAHSANNHTISIVRSIRVVENAVTAVYRNYAALNRSLFPVLKAYTSSKRCFIPIRFHTQSPPVSRVSPFPTRATSQTVLRVLRSGASFCRRTVRRRLPAPQCRHTAPG